MMALKEPAMNDAGKPAKRPMSPRRKLYLAAIGLAVVTGALLGLWRRAVSPDAPNTALLLVTNAALTPSFAIGASLLWTIGMAICLLLFHRAVDDHEERAMLWAGLAAWYAFAFTAPVWWVLHRASLVVAPDVMLILLVALAVNAIVWLWLKFR